MAGGAGGGWDDWCEIDGYMEGIMIRKQKANKLFGCRVLSSANCGSVGGGWKCRQGRGRGEVPQWHEAVHVVDNAHRVALFCVIRDISEGR